MYASAGYDCLTPDGLDYKTINRRVNMAFRLNDHIDVSGALLGKRGHRRIEAVQAVLSTLELHTAADVMRYCGELPAGAPRPRPVPAEPVSLGRRAIDRPDVVHITTDHLGLCRRAIAVCCTAHATTPD